MEKIKGFLYWFKASTKMKRWMLLIIVGIILACFGFSKIFVTNEIGFYELAELIALFAIGFTCVVLGIVFIQKRTLEIFIEANDVTSKKDKKSKVNINSLIFNKKVYEEGPKIVVLGGGDGLNTVIKGLKKYTSNITAIVTMSDYGEQMDESRKELKLLPFNDIKESIVALSDREDEMRKVMNLSFENPRLKNLSFGDIYLLAMQECYGSLSESIRKSTEVLNIIGRVLPVTLDEVTICAELNDGTTVEQKNQIPEVVSEKVEKINRIYISPSNCKPAPGVLKAIQEADAIIIGPGSLYTNVIPNLLVNNVSKAIKESNAIKVYVTNIMTEPGQTDNYSISDHIDAIIEHAGKGIFEFCIADTGEVVPEYVRKYNKEGSDVVEQDISKASTKGIKVIQKNMSCIRNGCIRHNPDVIAIAIIELICNDLKFKDKQRSAQYVLLKSILDDTKKAYKTKRKKVTKEKELKKKENKKSTNKPRKDSKFKSKYKDRIQAIQDIEETIKANRKALEENRKNFEINVEENAKISEEDMIAMEANRRAVEAELEKIEEKSELDRLENEKTHNLALEIEKLERAREKTKQKLERKKKKKENNK